MSARAILVGCNISWGESNGATQGGAGLHNRTLQCVDYWYNDVSIDRQFDHIVGRNRLLLLLLLLYYCRPKDE